MYDCKAPLSRFYYPDTRRIINAFIISIIYSIFQSKRIYKIKTTTIALVVVKAMMNTRQILDSQLSIVHSSLID